MISEYLPGKDNLFPQLYENDEGTSLEKSGKGLFLAYSIIENEVLRVVGAASFYLAPAEAILERFKIDDGYRNMGYGTDFMLEIMLYLCDKGYEKLSCVMRKSDSEYFQRIAEKLKMTKHGPYGAYYRFLLKDISGLDHRYEIDNGVECIEEATENDLEKLSIAISESEDCPYIHPLYSAFIEKKISLYHKENNDIDGAIFFDNVDGLIYLSYLWVDSDDMSILQKLLATAYMKVRKRYGREVTIEAYATNLKVSMLLTDLGVGNGDIVFGLEKNLSEFDEFFDDDTDYSLESGEG